jgi:DNA gyrase subunit A
MKVSDLRVLGRATQGVKLINLRETDEIASITKVDTEDEMTDEQLTDSETVDTTIETLDENNNN